MPGQGTFWQNTLLFKCLLTFCPLFVVVLNNIHKQRYTLEKVRILSNYHYWLLCLFSTKQMLAPCLRCQLCTIEPFSNSGPKFRKIKLSRYLLHSNALQVSRWPLGNTKDFLFCFIKRGFPNHWACFVFSVFLISWTPESCPIVSSIKGREAQFPCVHFMLTLGIDIFFTYLCLSYV